MKHKFLKLTALALALTMILPVALLGCSDAIFNETVMDAISNKDQTNNSTPAEKTTEAGVALDLTTEWETLYGANTLVQGCLVINRAFAESHPNEVAKFLSDYEHSVNTIKAADNNAVNLVVNAGILPKAAIAQKALPNCNLCYFAGDNMKPLMNTFCEKMLTVAPASIGNSTPADEFYYQANGDASEANHDLQIKVYALNGTTALGMAEMIANEDTDDMNYSISLYADAQTVAAAVTAGDCDIAALPTNLAAKLFNASGKIQLLALNTRGVLYLLQQAGSTKITSLNDLIGKTIYLPGTGSNPEFIMRAILQSAGLISSVTLDTTTYSTPDELANAFAAGYADFVVLPEPKVTVALTQANAPK